MKILMVSWFFPPTNTMGALRLGKLAQFLAAQGEEIVVLTAREIPAPQSLPMALPDSLAVLRTGWSDPRALPHQFAAALRQRPGRRAAIAQAASGGSSLRTTGAGLKDSPPGLLERGARAASRWYAEAVSVPDWQIGWLAPALREGGRLLRRWRPDVIFASAPPYTGLMVGARLSRRHDIPLVVELRDRWTDDPYVSLPGWRKLVEGWLERSILGSARAIVTVSEPWAKTYAAAHGKPSIAVLNGFDPEDYSGLDHGGASDTAKLVIGYTGRIFPGRRDPSPLFEAMALRGGDDTFVRFHGCGPEQVMPLAARYGVTGSVEVGGHLAYHEAIRQQARSDVLLLLQWNDPAEQGNVPGKLFEYLAARRPILGHGFAEGVPARIIAQRGAGLYSNAPREIAAQLDRWAREKRENGRIPPLDLSVTHGFSRQEQFEALLHKLRDVAGEPARRAGR